MQDEIVEYLRAHRSMTLSFEFEGEVRAATTCYALSERLTVYFFVFRDSQRHRAILAHPQVSAVVDDGFQIPMRGVELIGNAVVVEGERARVGQRLLTQQHPELQEAWGDQRLLIAALEAERVRIIDWTQGLGHSHHAALAQRPEPH